MDPFHTPPSFLRFHFPFFFHWMADNIFSPPGLHSRTSRVLMPTPIDQAPDSLERSKLGLSLLSVYVPLRRRVLMIGARTRATFF
jgi:hypothetical protein